MKKGRLSLLFLFVFLMAAVFILPVGAEGTPKACLVLSGAINDQSFCQSGYEGLMSMRDLGFDTSFIEQVPLTDYELVIRNFAEEDCDLVLAHGGEFSDPIKNVAAEFPETQFACVNCSTPSANLATLASNDEQLAYLAGILAAKMSKTGIVGYIGGIEIPPTLRHEFGFRLGAESEGAKVLATFTGTFRDIAKAKEAALSQVEQGMDVIYYYLNVAGSGVLEACQEDKQCLVIGSISDQAMGFEDIVIGTAVQNVGALYYGAGKLYLEGKLEGQDYLFGIENEELERIDDLYNVPEEIAEYVEEIRSKLISGEIIINRQTN